MTRALFAAAAVLLGAAEPSDSFERVADALSSGFAAERAHEAPARTRAAAILAAEGAHPIGSGNDLVRAWSGPRRPPAYRDRALGPGYRLLRLSSGEAARLEQTFLAGRRARVLALSPDHAGFTLTVKDDDGVRSCVGSPTRAECSWLPVYTTRITISLINQAGRSGDFLLLVR